MVLNEIAISVSGLSVDYHEYFRERPYSIGKTVTKRALTGISLDVQEEKGWP